MAYPHLPPEIAELRERTRRFIREVVVDAEPVPGGRLDQATRDRLQAAAKEAGVFAPLVPKEYGGQGLPIEHWSPILQEAGYSPIGPAALNCMAPDEGNMHMLNLVATEEQKKRYLAPLTAGDVRSCFGMTEPHPGAGSDPAGLRTTAYAVNEVRPFRIYDDCNETHRWAIARRASAGRAAAVRAGEQYRGDAVVGRDGGA
ncbi:acyl-CoA dehydrogenase family protein [Streptomyces eurythermus]|uniref:acyl-CoA dehydrogenase family protein n=1 Tax=Streptomyces eurythermus TaxID=42237 RepID=UPI0036F4BA4C